jgi:glycosyltransferase involved in cell wall biosynthesis
MTPETQNVLMIRLHLTLAKSLLTQKVCVTSLGIGAQAGVANRENEVNAVPGLRYVSWIWHGSSVVSGLRAIPTLTHLIREVSPTVIHVNAVSDLLPVAIAVRITCHCRKRPVIVSMSRNRPTWTSRCKAWLTARLIKHLADGFVALAVSHGRQMLALGIPSQMLTCIPNPYDETLVNLAAQEKQKGGTPPSHSPRITYVAALRGCKAQDVLVKAAASVIQGHPKVKFDLIGSAWPGEEAYEEELRRLIDQLQLGDYVHLPGGLPHAEVMTSLASTDIVAFPTYAEMMPRAVIEAMVLGKPVIASAVDGIPDLIQDRKTGLLVRPGDIDGLAKAISELIENPTLASELAAAGQTYVREFCSPERVGHLFCEFYATLLRHKR